MSDSGNVIPLGANDGLEPKMFPLINKKTLKKDIKGT